jgi:hypothetical protein
MTGTNHYLTGVAIAIVFRNPLLAAPMAFASHFALDVLPHFGLPFNDEKEWKVRKVWQLRASVVDTLALTLAVVLTLQQYPVWYMFIGIVAMSPDVAWIYRYVIKERFGTLKPGPAHAFNIWHYSIKKLERWWGAFVEVPFAITLFILLFA